MATITGRCLCGQMTVIIPKEALNAGKNPALCHCKNCCRVGGCLGSINVFVQESNVQIKGEPNIYQDGDTDSGASIARAFCGYCGTPIYSRTPTAPGSIFVKLPLFDEMPKPQIEIFCASLPSWSKPIEGMEHFDRLPTK